MNLGFEPWLVDGSVQVNRLVASIMTDRNFNGCSNPLDIKGYCICRID